jgi:hypothetical protein
MALPRAHLVFGRKLTPEVVRCTAVGGWEMEPGTVGGFEVAGTRSLSPDIVAKGVLTIAFLLPSWMLLWVFARKNLQNLEGYISTTLCLTVRLTLRPVVCADMVTSLEKPLANFLQRRHMILYESEQDRTVSVQAILNCFLCVVQLSI